MNKTLGLLLLSTPILLISPAFARPTFDGSGCLNDGTDATFQFVEVNMDSLPDRLEILFSSLVAEQGPGIPSSRRSKTCNVAISMLLRPGLQYSITDVTYIGFAALPWRVVGVQQSSFWQPSGTPTLKMQMSTFTGGYHVVDTPSSLVWSRCGQDDPLHISTRVYLSGLSLFPAKMTVDQSDSMVHQIYGLTWRRCA
jgi:hypothetical protein